MSEAGKHGSQQFLATTTTILWLVLSVSPTGCKGSFALHCHIGRRHANSTEMHRVPRKPGITRV